LTGANFIPFLEWSCGNLCAVQKRSIGAVAVRNPATLRPAVHGKMQAGHERVMRHSEVGFLRRAADQNSLPPKHCNPLALERPCLDFQDDGQCLVQNITSFAWFEKLP
jgi:hypothetical protein